MSRLGRYRTRERYERGLVVVLPGVEGEGIFNWLIVHGLGQGGVPYAMEVYDWTTGVFAALFVHIATWRRNKEQARRIAERIERYAVAHPDRPIWLVGQSGGGGMAVLAMEALSDGVTLEGAVLIAPALWRDHNLCTALRRVRDRTYHYFSGRDVFFLGLWTHLLGTIDRVHGACAGRTGFRRPAGITGEEEKHYDSRLVQIDCSRGLWRTGHIGLHLTSSSPKFIREVVAPRILRGG